MRVSWAAISQPPSRRGRPPGAVLEALVGQHLLAGAQLLGRRGGVVLAERAEVALVDGGHRGEVTGAHALEGADEELAVLGGTLSVDSGRVAEGLQQPVGAAQPAADVGADEHLVLAPGLEPE
jgi:hypothetical protein